MARLPPNAGEDSGPDVRTGLTANRRPPTPRWVKVFAVIGIIVILLILVVAVADLAGLGGEHGPGRHNRPAGNSTTSADNHTSPAGHHTLAASYGITGEPTSGHEVAADPVRVMAAHRPHTIV